MRRYVNLDTLFLQEDQFQAQAVVALYIQRGGALPLELQFIRNGVPELLPEGSVIRLMIKKAGEFDGDPVIFEQGFSAPADSGGYYTADPETNTEPLNDLLNSPDGNSSNDLEQVILGGVLSWRLGSAPPKKTRSFRVVAENSYDNGNETLPDQAGPDLDSRISALEAAEALGEPRGKTLYVDSVNGNDASALRGREDRPFLTLAAVMAAQLAGDTVFIGPGTYNIGTDFYAPPVNGAVFGYGATIVGSRSFASGGGVLKPANGARVFGLRVESSVFNSSACAPLGLYINGSIDSPVTDAVFTDCTFYGGQDTVLVIDLVASAPSEISFERCTVVTDYDGFFALGATVKYITRDCTILCGVGSGTVHAWVASSSGTIEATGCRVDIAMSSGSAAQSIAGGVITLNACSLTVSGAGNIEVFTVGSGSSITAIGCYMDSNGGDFADVAGTLVVVGGETTPGKGLALTGGAARLRNITIDTSANASANPVTKSGGTLLLENCRLLAHSTRDSISSPTPQTVTSFGTYANRPVDGDVTIVGILTDGSPAAQRTALELQLTMSGGGAIDTTGRGSIQLGAAANRVTVDGPASGSYAVTQNLVPRTGNIPVAKKISVAYAGNAGLSSGTEEFVGFSVTGVDAAWFTACNFASWAHAGSIRPSLLSFDASYDSGSAGWIIIVRNVHAGYTIPIPAGTIDVCFIKPD
jgi:hypothetical protein